MPTPRLERYQPFGFANSIERVTYDWPSDAQIGVLSCFNNEFILYRMQVDTVARRRHGDEPPSSRDLHVISAAIFAFTGTPPTTARVQLLLAQQPRRSTDIDATLALPGGYTVLLQYDSFAINWLRWQAPNAQAL